MELDRKPGIFAVAGECWSMRQMESVVLDIPAELRSPAISFRVCGFSYCP
jgi:hypothetical protein